MKNMPLPSFHDIYSQFIVDAPRIKFYIDGVAETNTDMICAYFMQDENGTFDQGINALHWCTQTALAPIYIEKWREIAKARGDGLASHLVDDGPQTIRIAGDTIRIAKPFKIMNEVQSGTLTKMEESGNLNLTVRLRWYTSQRGKRFKVRTKWRAPRPKRSAEEWCLICDSQNPS